MCEPIESLMTVEQYELLADDPHYRDELSRGRLVREPRPGARHDQIAFDLAVALRAFVDTHGLGRVVMDAGYRLPLQPPSVRGPDVSFIARQRLPAELPVGFWPLAPDLAVEVLSPSNTASEIESKVLEFLDAGTRMVWVIDPESRTARIYEGNEARIVRDHEDMYGGDVIPGFRISLSSILP
jgi:Uma2 family endonuclease